MTADANPPFVTLELAGPGVDPSDLTGRLGVAPTSTSGAPAQVPSWGFWTLSTRGRIPGNRLADHLRWLGDSFGSRLKDLREIAATHGARLLAQGTPESWELDEDADEVARARVGLPLSFVV